MCPPPARPAIRFVCKQFSFRDYLSGRIYFSGYAIQITFHTQIIFHLFNAITYSMKTKQQSSIPKNGTPCLFTRKPPSYENARGDDATITSFVQDATFK
jgi:hypothetical protein